MLVKSEEFPALDTVCVLRVSYGEVDAMGYVYYGHYPHWFERARSQFIRERGMSYAEVEARGVLLPVRDMSIRYVRPARFDDEVRVRAGIGEWGRASIVFVYQVFGPPEGGTLLATGMTRHACASRDGKPIAAPDWLKALFVS